MLVSLPGWSLCLLTLSLSSLSSAQSPTNSATDSSASITSAPKFYLYFHLQSRPTFLRIARTLRLGLQRPYPGFLDLDRFRPPSSVSLVFVYVLVALPLRWVGFLLLPVLYNRFTKLLCKPYAVGRWGPSHCTMSEYGKCPRTAQ